MRGTSSTPEPQKKRAGYAGGAGSSLVVQRLLPQPTWVFKLYDAAGHSTMLWTNSRRIRPKRCISAMER